MRLNWRSYKTTKRAVMRHLHAANLRSIVGELDKWQCVYCGKRKIVTEHARWTVDHLQPVCRLLHMQTHKINDVQNLVLACLECNTSFGSKGPEEKILRFGRFLKTPKRASDVLPEEYLVFDAELFDRASVSRVT